MKLVFCGTPRFAVPTLEAIIAARHDIRLVVTQPDRPVGRSQALTAPPVKQLALSAGLPVTQPEKIRNNIEFREHLQAIAPDAIVVVAYGRIIPPWMLDLPRYGCINLHASLLPKYRGAAPIQWAIAMGETITGSTTMLLEEGLDTGPILLQQALAIDPGKTALDLFEELAVGGAPLMVHTLAGLASGEIIPRPQDHERATLAPILQREDGRMDFAARTAVELKNRWRGFQPWPGAFTTFKTKHLIVHRMETAGALPGSGNASDLPGQAVARENRLFVACAQSTWLELIEVQLEGKKRMTAAEFLRGLAPMQQSDFRLG
ncbi:methionyl-tRNA formyltransferase [Acidobacteria bacterium AB60]|nr:methionyl-tRNA formyltransferase [Acidobacteria bacterium AB60]